MSESNQPDGDIHALIVAAGSGERSGLAQPKQYQKIYGKPMVRHCVERFQKHHSIGKVWVVIGSGQEEMLAEALDGISGCEVVIGGQSRQESVSNGLKAVQADGCCNTIFVHDAARPLLDTQVLDRLLATRNKADGAIPVLPTIDTTVTLEEELLGSTIDRDTIWRVQTPQLFDFGKLATAHSIWPENRSATDDSQIFKAAGNKIMAVDGDEKLKKYTTAQDFAGAQPRTMMRTGMGYDVHQLAKGEDLWLGGLKIEHDRGLAGHSDADVLLHALTDALLGSIGAGDIGDHFPPSDPKWAGASSDQFVKHAATLVRDRDGQINNVDMTIICEAPKIKPHRETIRKNIAEMLDISRHQVSVKATTTEGLGFAGRREGIAAQAIATISMEEI